MCVCGGGGGKVHVVYVSDITGWEGEVHVTPPVDLYSGKSLCETCRVSFRLFIYVT